MAGINVHPFVVMNREGKLPLQESEEATFLCGKKEIIFCMHLCWGDELVIAHTKLQQFFGLGTKKAARVGCCERTLYLSWNILRNGIDICCVTRFRTWMQLF